MPRRAGEGGNLDPERIVFNEDEIHGELRTSLRLYLLGRSIPIGGPKSKERAQLSPLPFTLTLTFVVERDALPQQAREPGTSLSRFFGSGKLATGDLALIERNQVPVSVKMNREDLLQRLAQGQTMEAIFDFQRGYPEGTTERVYELAVRPSVGG